MGGYKRKLIEYQGWNVPFEAGDTAICESNTTALCYKSCEQLQKCEKCSWAPCYDDLLFMKDLVRHVKEELCIDEDRVYLSGFGSGGMFAYYLSQQMPEVFTGFMFDTA